MGFRDELLKAKFEELRFLLDDTPKADAPKVRELWQSWAHGMKQMKSEATIDSLRVAWRHFEPIIGNLRVEEITGEYWTNEIIPKVRAKTHPGFKFFNMRKWLAMFLKWAEENQKVPFSYKRPRLVDPDPPRAPGRAYSIEETDALIAHADWLLRPKIVMALEHFMRRSEIALLSWDRVDRTKRVIHLRAQDTKIRKARSFPYNQKLETMFVELKERQPVSPFVFPSPINAQRSIGRAGFTTAWGTCKFTAGVKGKFHWLRHTALTRAAKAPTINVPKVCQFAGLRIDEFQRTYMHLDTEDLRGVEVW